MADYMSFEVEGLNELISKVDKLEKNIVNEVIKPSVKSSMKKAREIAISKVPVNTGELKRHIAHAWSRPSVKGGVAAVVMVRKKRKLSKRELKKIEYSGLETYEEIAEQAQMKLALRRLRLAVGVGKDKKKRLDRTFGYIRMGKKGKKRLVRWDDKAKNPYVMNYIAHLVEYGTKRSKAKPFIRPALKQANPTKALEKAIDEGYKKFGLK